MLVCFFGNENHFLYVKKAFFLTLWVPIILPNYLIELIPILFPSSIGFFFSASLHWLFIILISSFSFLHFSSSLMILVYSWWQISESISARDIIVSMLFNLLLASITILVCFFFVFLVAFNSFFMIPIVIENAKLKFALAIPTDASIALAKEAIDTPPLVADKTIRALSN